MLENIQKLSAISGILEMLSCMEGCEVTSQMASLLAGAVERLDEVGDDLKKCYEAIADI